jgi:hypothetical protein
MKHWNSIDGRDMEVEISYVIEKKKYATHLLCG